MKAAPEGAFIIDPVKEAEASTYVLKVNLPRFGGQPTTR
jgi:hypothetical protein